MKLTKFKESYLDSAILMFLGIGFITSGLSIAMSSYGVAGMIILLTVKILRERKFSFDDKIILYILLIFMVWQIITSLLSNNTSEALINSLRKISLCSVFFCAILVITNQNRLKKLLLALFIFTAIISTYESIRYIIDFNSQNESSLSDFRLNYFGHSITIGEIKMMVLVLMLPFILSKQKFILNKWVLLSFSLPIFLSMYFTNSRNAILGFFAAIVVIGIVKHRYFLGASIVIVTLFLFLAPMQLKERILSIADLEHPSNKSRIVMWETGLKMIKAKPLLGYGDVDILPIYKKYKEPEYYAEGSHMHNNVMQIFVMYGAIGLIIWFVLMIYILLKQIKLYNKIENNEFLRIIVLSSLACMAAFQVSGLTEWNFGDAEFEVLLWFTLSLPFVVEKIFMTKEAHE